MNCYRSKQAAGRHNGKSVLGLTDKSGSVSCLLWTGGLEEVSSLLYSAQTRHKVAALSRRYMGVCSDNTRPRPVLRRYFETRRLFDNADRIDAINSWPPALEIHFHQVLHCQSG